MSQEPDRFSGEQLRLARIAWGLSLDEVGQAVGATRQYVQQLETGAKKPNGEMVSALSDILDVKNNFLHTLFESSVKPEQCHFRKQFSTPASLTSQVLARGTILDRIVSELDSCLRLPLVNFPDATVNNVNEVEQIAEYAREYWGLGLGGPIVSVMRVVENAGAIVTCLGGISERIDALSMARPRPIIVRSSSKESLCRLRFDIAHEIGHLILHRGVQTGNRETEDQANCFASAFLLPRAAFIREFPRGKNLNWGAIFELKLRWKVSARALVRRAYDLDLISATQYRTANIRIVKSGQAKNERYDEEMPLEEPELLDRALERLNERGPSMLAGINERIGLGKKIFELVTGYKFPEKTIERDFGPNVVKFPGLRQ